VGAGILLSRISGVLREVVIAYLLGSSRLSDVFYAGLKLPNVLQNLLGEGTLSASFIPVYARFLEEGREEEAGRFAGAALGLLAVAAFGAALVGVGVSPFIAALFPRFDPEAQRLLVQVLRIFFPMAAVLVVSAWALGILNSRRRFFVSYVAPVAWNLSIVAGGGAVAAGIAGGGSAGGATAESIVVGLAWGGLVGGALQLLVQLPFLGRSLYAVRPSLSTRVEGVREAIANLGPVVAARGALNISSYVDVLLAGLLVAGAVTHLQRAQILYLLPISLFGMAVAAAELPELSRAGPEAGSALAGRVRAALARVRFLLIPSAVAYLAFGEVLVSGLFQRGAFEAADSRVVGLVLAAYALGLPASGASRTLSSAFYALRDTRTPARIAVLRMVLSLAVAVALVFPLDRIRVGPYGLGAAGLALGASLAAWVEYALLRRRLEASVGGHGPGWGGLVRLLAAAGVAAGVALAALRWGWPLLAGVLAPELAPGALLTGGEGGPSAGAGTVEGFGGPAGVLWIVRAAGTAALFGVVYLGCASALGEGPRPRGATD
jgi:putative peptidoglycan lipid II flippase